MSKRSRRRHSPEQKTALLKRHLADKKPVSAICTEAQIQPRILQRQERDLPEAAPALFASR